MADKISHKGNKQYLATKTCDVCKRPFSWRKKWEKNWDHVKYCSDACRKLKKNVVVVD